MTQRRKNGTSALRRQRISRTVIVALLATATSITIGHAQETPKDGTQSTSGDDQNQTQGTAAAHGAGLWERDVLSGDWGGLRSALEANGMQLGSNYIGEVLGNPTGGTRQGAIYEGRLELFVNLDLEKAVGWSGALFHANAYRIDGRGLSANDLGNNLLVVSNIEASRSTRLFDLWLQQDLFDGVLQVRAGQIAADDEFFTSQYAANFINSTFGWPGILASDLPSGGPAYPLATPGARIKLQPTGALSLSTAVFNDNPAGPGNGNPQLRDASGTSFRVNDGALVIGEAAYALNQEKDATGLPATFKLGAWYDSGRFADQHFDTTGRSLADPASSGVAAQHDGNYGVYAIVDQMIWRRPETTDNGLGAFLRLAGNPSDRNLINFYADTGVNYKGLIPSRGDDVFGVAFAYARISDAASARDRDAQSFSGSAKPVRDYEAALEIMYRAQLAPWWTVQPDLQVIFHPGGSIADPSDPRGIRTISDAVILGLRTAVTF
jgi:porin